MSLSLTFGEPLGTPSKDEADDDDPPLKKCTVVLFKNNPIRTSFRNFCDLGLALCMKNTFFEILF